MHPALITICIIAGVILALLLWFYFLPYSFGKVLLTLLRHTIYQVEFKSRGNIPYKGPALLLANHVSPFDCLIIMGMTRRKVHIMMNSHFFRAKFFMPVFRRFGFIEVPQSNHPKEMQSLFQKTQQLLREGKLVCVFAEGGVSENGLISNFKSGILQMLPEDIHVPLVPVRIGMMRGTLFTVYKGKIRHLGGRSLPLPISVMVGKEISHDITPFQLRQRISEMGAEIEMLPYRCERTVHYQFLRQAKAHPFRASYKDAGSRAVKNITMLIKSLIISRKVRELDQYTQSDLIGVLLPNCTNLTAVIFGILYADKTPAILNFSSGEETIRKVVDRAGIKVILTSHKFVEKLGLTETPDMIFLEDVAKTITKGVKRQVMLDTLLLPSSWLIRKYSPENFRDLNGLLVVLFSSGSTGVPKGVMLTHRNINSNIQSFGRAIKWTTDDVLLGYLPLFHAFGFCVCFAFPAVEGVHVSYTLNPLDANMICNCVEKDKCTIMVSTPTFLQNYMRKYKPGQFKSLRLTITGAEKLRHDIAGKFKELTGLEVIEGFGCTELSPIVCINLSQSIFHLGKEYGKKGSIGAPMPGIHVKIVDPDTLEELPPNTPGLMLVKGGLVMKGYWNDEENTRKAMKDGYYITGDIVSMDEMGYLTITGRLSRFSKIAGEMVPHEMVEMAINEELKAESRVIAVTACEDSKRGERLIVFYSLEDFNADEIIEKLRARNLPNLWIPKAEDFIKIDQIPLLGSGKVDLQALKKNAAAYAK